MKNFSCPKLPRSLPSPAWPLPSFAQVGRDVALREAHRHRSGHGHPAHFPHQYPGRRLQDLSNPPRLDLGWQLADLPLQPRPGDEAFAVNETTGKIVQVTDKGYMGMLCVARKSMKLYLMRDEKAAPDIGRDPYVDAAAAAIAADAKGGAAAAAAPTPTPNYVRAPGSEMRRPRGPFQVVEVRPRKTL